MTRLKKLSAITILVTTFSLNAFSQEYLDSDKRFMKLTVVSTDKTFGFELNNPIKVGSDEKAIGAYLNSLKTLDGDRIHIGDMKFNYKNKTGKTMVVLTYEQKKETTTIYFLTTEYEQPKAIVGFSFKTIDDIPKVVVFPADSILKVTACSKTIYLVDDFLAKEKFGELSKPTTTPTFTSGLDELKKYFSTNPLTDERVKESIFRVSIAFMVNCEGKAGNFVVVTKGRGDLATYANQVLAIVNRMPQNWQPATVDGKTVDCYQVLSFSVSGGQLDNVSYR
ncbi:hypothetical protein [Limnovirga soli]|uniref:TonB C-terminal domain-containing protein n=1 Tax=Limnovirga soli TaxID=2656915 RepID=A0A8J8JUP2_9BACT|nr:hypothetical protein [Limnovirga soli]NNV56510.1 hypothetical protein [Limnovirga soli]